MRKLLTDLYVMNGHQNWVDEDDRKHLPKGFVFDVMVGLYKTWGAPHNEKAVDSSEYHVKEEENKEDALSSSSEETAALAATGG